MRRTASPSRGSASGSSTSAERLSGAAGAGGLPSAGGPSIRRVVAYLSASTLLTYLVIFGVGGAAVGWALRSAQREDIAQRTSRARHFLHRQADVRVATAREYAWWDDTWRFIDEPQSAWATRFVRENYTEWMPARYGDQVITIWDLRRHPVFAWSDSAAVGVASVFEAPERFAFIDSAKAAAGLVATPRGLFLAAFSVVVLTADQEGTGPWHGYLTLALPVSGALMQEWSADLGERLEILQAPDEAARLGDSTVTVRVSGGDSLRTRFAVRGLFGEPVAVAVLTGAVGYLADLRMWTLAVLVAAGVVGLMLIALVGLTGHRALVRPLETTAHALAQMRAGGRLVPLGSPAQAREWEVFVGAFNTTVEALRASEALYGNLFAQAGDALFVLEGPSQVIVDANPSAERLTGSPRAELVGRLLPAFLEPGGATETARGVHRIRRRVGPASTVEIVTGDVEVAGRHLTLASVRDQTDREALEAQLRESQKMELLGRLAGGIAHDFNNLLGGILVSAGTLREEFAVAGTGHDAVETIERAARRGGELTRQLLSYARREPPRREPVAIGTLLADVQRLCVRTFAPAITVLVRDTSAGAAVLGDASLIEQALLNLCLNGRDAMPGGGTLTLEAAVEEVDSRTEAHLAGLSVGRYAVLAVADTGPGIAPEVRAHLFEPFFTTKARGEGTGLGLATSYGTVRAHGGVVVVQSEPGHGARFAIYLPYHHAGPTAPVAQRVGGLPGGTEMLLLVDDSEAVRRAVRQILTRLGYLVVEATTGREGVALFSERPEAFGLVLLDVLMPDLGGVETFRALRVVRPDVRLLVITGFATGPELQEMVDGGAEGILLKPFDIVELATTVRRILDAPHGVPPATPGPPPPP